MTVLEIVELLEGPVAPVECLAEDYQPGSCSREPECLSRPLWARLQQAFREVLGGTTLADMMRDPGMVEPECPVSTLPFHQESRQTAGV